MNQSLQQRPLSQPTLFDVQHDGMTNRRKYFDIVIGNKIFILAIACIFTLLGAAYTFIAKPIYEASILVQVENIQAPTDRMLGELSQTLDLRTATAPELEVLRSRMVVSRAVDSTRLYITVRPKYFPGIGEWIARNNEGLTEPGLLGYGGYVWGSEKASVREFNVPPKLLGSTFTLTAGPDHTFSLSSKEEGIYLTGRVGQHLRWGTKLGDVEIYVDELYAKSGAQFRLERFSRLESIENLQRALKIAEKGKQSGVISVSLEGTDPNRTSFILNEIGRQYIRQNEDRKSEGAEKSLAFLDRQLPELKQALEAAETKYNEMRNKLGTIDLGEEAKGLLQLSVAAQTKMMDLTQRKEEMTTRFAGEHPLVIGISQQMRALNRELADLSRRIKKLPEIEQDVLRLSRDVKVNTEVYTAVLGTAQQLRLASASKIGTVRLLDAAEPPVEPIKPRRTLITVAAAAIGLLLGTLGAYVRKMYFGRIDAPADVEQLLVGLPVSAAIPHSESQKKLSSQIRSDKPMHGSALLQHRAPDDGALESLRRLRTSMQYAMRDSSNNIIAITGPTAEVGKSFVAANLSAMLASIGKKVLLIDSDLRTGHLHRYFALSREEGLAEGIEGQLPVERIIRKHVIDNVDFIPTGALPSKPAELLAYENLGHLLRGLSAQYDYILIDTAPVLLVSDALTVAPHAGATFNIVRSGVTTAAEIEEATRQLNQAGAVLTGIVFNDSKSRQPRYGYNARYGASLA